MENKSNKTSFDIVIEMLKTGWTQQEVSVYLKQNNYKPCSLSYIEKELKKYRDQKGCRTVFELMYKLGLRDGLL